MLRVKLPATGWVTPGRSGLEQQTCTGLQQDTAPVDCQMCCPGAAWLPCTRLQRME